VGLVCLRNVFVRINQDFDSHLLPDAPCDQRGSSSVS